jgi:hypothetical protein
MPQSNIRLASGQEVELVNIALNGGVLINSKTMLSPGSFVRLKVNSLESGMVLEGRVHRCKVVGLKQAKIQYEAVILLEDGFPEPLAEMLCHSGTEKRSAGCCSREINPSGVGLPETAELWILTEATA